MIELTCDRFIYSEQLIHILKLRVDQTSNNFQMRVKAVTVTNEHKFEM